MCFVEIDMEGCKEVFKGNGVGWFGCYGSWCYKDEKLEGLVEEEV